MQPKPLCQDPHKRDRLLTLLSHTYPDALLYMGDKGVLVPLPPIHDPYDPSRAPQHFLLGDCFSTSQALDACLHALYPRGALHSQRLYSTLLEPSDSRVPRTVAVIAREFNLSIAEIHREKREENASSTA